MSSKKRTYVKRQRAAKQEETRRRIAAATAELHEEVGPARTTIAEIAKRAGVQRPTVYNNFPDDKTLFAACQAHFLERSPFPDLQPAFARADPGERLEAVLRLVYGWWRRNQRMAGNVSRDRRAMPALDELMRETSDAQMAELAGALAAGLGRRRETAALVRLAFRFETWESLAASGLSDAAAARAMASCARASCT